MGLTKCTVATDVIGTIGTTVEARGLTTQQFKDKFDEMPEGIKNYLNNTLTVELDILLNQSVLRQAIINGNFSINQRAKSGTITLAAGVYGHDRWKAGASGCTYTFATTANVTTITITAGSLIQVIEGRNLYSGTYTLSWEGTATGKIGAGSFSASGVTGTIVGGTNTNIEFSTGTLSNVQFNFGNVALPFLPKSFDDELKACMRYFEKSYDYATAPGTATITQGSYYNTRRAVAVSTAGVLVIGNCTFKVTKRISPTITLYSPGGASGAVRVQNVNNRTGATAGLITDSGFTAVNLDNTSAQGIAVDDLIEFHWVAESEL